MRPITEHTSIHLQHCLDRLQVGDLAGRNELVNCAHERLLRLTGKMLQFYPCVKRWEQADDVFQNAMVRLCRALQQVIPPSVADFFGLAALQIRRELIDLARHYHGPHGLGTNCVALEVGGRRPQHPAHAAGEPADFRWEPGRLAIWGEVHATIASLPDDERETFNLLWHQQLTQAQAAGLLNVSERTVKRRWQSARIRLHGALRGDLAELFRSASG